MSEEIVEANPNIQSMVEMVGITQELAKDYLAQYNNNLEAAINAFFDGEEIKPVVEGDNDNDGGEDGDDDLDEILPSIGKKEVVRNCGIGSNRACVDMILFLKEVNPILPIELVLLITQNFYFSFLGRTMTIAGQKILGHVDGDIKIATVNYPMSICVDPSKNIIMSDYTEHNLRKISANLTTMSTLAGVAGSSGIIDTLGGEARFFNPIGICCDHNGNVFVADYGNNKIRKVTPLGEVTTYPPKTEAIGFQDGEAPRFSGPYGVCFDLEGNLLIADCQNHKIRKVDQFSLEVSTIAGSTSGCEDGDSDTAKFSCPVCLVVDNNGDIIVSDFNNSKIRKIIVKENKVVTLAGLDGGYADGDSKTAKFNNPVGICISGNDLIVADYNNQKIRRLSLIDSMVQTICGGEKGDVDGDENETRFSAPIGICNYSRGVVLVTDASNHTIRKVFV
jgi:DNA-binding beta-propeller fold protein YncE